MNKNTLILILLAGGLFASLLYNLEQNKEKKALQKSNSIITKEQDKIKAAKFEEIKYLDEEKSQILDSIELLKAEKISIELELSKLDKKQTQDEKVIRNMRDADSVQQLFSRYYPDHD